MKFSKKDNPLEVALYKMAGHDRHGAWYARHQVEEGLGFDKFKKALLREFPETLLTQGAPGAGAKRGLSAERRVERIEVDGVGRVEVYQLSAQMPSPVTPREFLTLFISTDDGLSEKSGAAAHDGKKHVPRNFMIVSRPLDHPDVPSRSSFVRGQYESVELIREIPLHVSPSKSSLALDSTSSNGEIDPELNPVEWIMVTRSDPAGGVPRFLVDRGTPGAMIADVSKFLNWACAQEEIPHQDADIAEQLQTSEQSVDKESVDNLPQPVTSQRDGSSGEDIPLQPQEPAPEAAATVTASGTQQAGLVSNLTSSLEAGVNTYAPTSVANFVNHHLHPETTTTDLSDSDSSSIDSFMSAEEMKRFSTAPEGAPDDLPRESTENLSIASGASSSELSRTDKKNLNHHEKEVLKITQQREKLEQKLAKQRIAQETKLKQSQEKEESEQVKARERMEKEIQKSEERHRKEIEKLEARREKELKKAEERRKKRADQDKLSLVARERDEFRSQADLLTKENDLLRDQVESLQRENTALANRLGKLGGQDALKSVQDEIGSRSRAGTGLSAEDVSMKSTGS
jgi:hypothetical protein